jgi:hypothetical protein
VRPSPGRICRALIAAVLVLPAFATERDGTDLETPWFGVLFTAEGAGILPRSAGPPPWTWGISLVRDGAPAMLRPSGPPLLVAGPGEAEYRRGRVVEWYRSGPSGLEHGLDIEGPAGLSILRFEFALAGSLVPKVSEDGRTVVYRDANGAPILADVDLSGVDAEGREVAARWERVEHTGSAGSVLCLDVVGADHAFPLRLSGRLTTPKGLAGGGLSPRPETAAAAPANDLCAGAEVIPAGPFPYLTAVLDVADATTAGDPPPSCQADVSRSVWFAFTPATTGAYAFSLCADAPTATTVEDTVLAIYSSTVTCGGLAAISGGCSDDACGPTGLQSSVPNVTLTAGMTYYLVAWIYGSAVPPPGGSSLQLRVDSLPPPGPAPANDRCEGAEMIPASGPFPYVTSVTSDMTGATTAGDPPAPSCQSVVSRSIWYSFVPASSGRYSFSLCADGPTGTTVDDTVLAVYAATGACSGFLEVAGGCDDDSCTAEAAQSELTGIALAAGARYYVVVWQYGTAAPAPAPGNTAVQLRVGVGAAPANDSCATAAALHLSEPAAGSTAGALDDTRLPQGSACFSGVGQTPSAAAGGDVAYAFTAPDDGRYSFRLSGYDPSRNAVLYVASDCPAGGSPALVAGCLGAANRSASFPEEVACLPLHTDQTVYVYVDEDSASPGSPFTIEAGRCAMESEPNDTPGAAGALACGVEGSIAPAGDVDFFALGAPAAGSRLFALVDGAAANSTDFDLRLTTAADTLEYDDYNNDVPFGSAAPNVSGGRLGGVASYLRVSHYSPAAQAEPYRLYAAVQPPAELATPEIEPNNSVATATGAANEYYAGALSDAADVDVYSFSAAAGELVQIGLDLDPLRDATPFNGSLALLDATGTTLLLVNDPSSTSSNATVSGTLAAATPYAPGEALVYRIRNGGTYYAKVAWSSGTPGDYLLSIAHDCRAAGPAKVDGDGDGVPDGADCAPADPSGWAVPGEATGLSFAAADPTRLLWSPPADPGGAEVRYDLLRSATAGDFGAAVCLAADTLATSGADAAAPGAAFFYLVRSENACGGNLGTRSDGTPRTAAPCP